MYITDDGLLVNDPDDFAKVTQSLRKTDYGAIATGEPILGVNHVYAIPVGYGKTSPQQDGTAGCASRVASGKAPYYPHVYMSLSGPFYQVCHLTRSAIHCEHNYADPGTGKTYQINKISIGIEWAGSGWFYKDGTDWTGPKGRKGWNGKIYDTSRPDFQLVGNYWWQKPSAEQIKAVAQFWQACLNRFKPLTPESIARGHGELAKGGHSMCPGPLILAAMNNDVLPILTDVEVTPVHPDQFVDLFSVPEPNMSIAPEDVFAEYPDGMTDEQLYAAFAQPEIECMARHGYITHDDVKNQMCSLNWFWAGDGNGPVCED